ncbi:MAG TPA: energy transducer TonB, partial [Steroidobacteraceae bacterium]|nr:energy transducer TonB [Steroidobacteraceae bacterium]
HSQFPELILMATGRRDEEHSVAALVSDQRIYRFLHKPVSPARANLFLSAASRRYNELRHVEPVHMTTAKQIAMQPRSSAIVVSIAFLLIVAAAVGVWLMLRQEPVAAAPPLRQAGTLTQEEQIADSLARGQMAIVTDRLVEPRGNNAVEYFRAVLALHPENADALAGLQRVGAALEVEVVEALQAQNPARGATALATLQKAVPDYPRLDALRAELLALSRSSRTPISAAPPSPPTPTPVSKQQPARTSTPRPAARAPAEQSQTQAPEAAAGPSAGELDAVARLRGRGILIEPPGANAYERVLALRTKYPESSEVRAEQQALAFAFLERTRTALAAGDVDTAGALLSRVDLLVPNMAATKSLQTQLAAAQQQRNFAANIVQAKTLKLVREVPPTYPREAEREGLSGWVDVEFTVAPTGATQDLVVRGSQPQRTFDQAAIDAVKRWRFEPVMRNGAPVPQRAAVRIRFQLK